MTVEIVPNPTTSDHPLPDDTTIANALIASGGDILLVTERLNSILPDNAASKVDASQVLEAFLRQAANIDIQNSVKALLMLNLLEILNQAKGQLIAAMGEFSGSELLRTVQLVVEGVTSLMPPPAASGPTINLLQQFGGDQAVDRVSAKLQQYRQLDEAAQETVPVKTDPNTTGEPLFND